MPDIRVGSLVRARNNLHGWPRNEVNVVRETFPNDGPWDIEFRIQGVDFTFAWIEDDFELVGNENDELEELQDIEEEPPEERPWQRRANRDVRYEQKKDFYLVLYIINDPDGDESPNIAAFDTKESAELEVGWFIRNGFKVLRTVKMTLGYNDD